MSASNSSMWKQLNFGGDRLDEGSAFPADIIYNSLRALLYDLQNSNKTTIKVILIPE